MAQTQVEIEVELTGTRKVEQGVKKIESGLEGIGETGSKLSQVMGATNDKLGEGLESVAGSVGGLREAFGGLGGAIDNIGNTGVKGFTALLGPLGMLVTAGLAVYETFRLITGAAQEAEEAQEAMNAAASDLQSKLEALAEKGVILSTKEMQEFSKAVLESQLAKEKVQFSLEKQRKIFFEVAEAQRELNELTEQSTNLEAGNFRQRMEALAGMSKARRRLAKAIEAEEKALANLNKEQRRAEEAIARAAEKEQAAEKMGKEEMRKEALKLLTLEKEINLLETRSEIGEDGALQIERRGEVEVEFLKRKAALEDASLQQIRESIKATKARAKTLEENADIETEKGKAIFKARRNLTEAAVAAAKVQAEIQKQRIKEIDQEDKRINQQLKSRRDQAKLRQAQRENDLRKEIVLGSKLNQLNIKLTQEGVNQALSLEKERHRAALKLTKEGSKEREIEEKRFQLAIRTIEQREEKARDERRRLRLEKEKQANEARILLGFDLARRMIEMETQEGGFGTDFERLTFESEQRLKILELEFQREINLAKLHGEELSRIQEKFSLERTAITQDTTAAQIELITKYFDQYAAGFVEAGYNALFFGDSFKEATAQILKGLGKQAAVNAALETAKGFSFIALGQVASAATAFKSAGLFAAAATFAGIASASLSGGGSSETGGAPVSPTGSPSTAAAPERERAENDSMVFNINFGGAVVYDTKKAAEQALADRLVSIINTPRRGAVQFNRR